jgi:hypothetical protein
MAEDVLGKDGNSGTHDESRWEWVVPAAVAVVGTGTLLAKRALNAFTLLGAGGLAVAAWFAARLIGRFGQSADQPRRADDLESQPTAEAPAVSEQTNAELDGAMVQYRAGAKLPPTVELAVGSDVGVTPVQPQPGRPAARGAKGLVVA